MAINKSLGRGLGALLNEDYVSTLESKSDSGHVDIPISDVVRNVEQPRKNFDDAAMSELVNSIRIHGVITPIIVVKRDDKYMIIAGERRWRAARKAALTTIPAIVRDYTPQQVKEISLIENLQREDLNSIETAEAIKQLMQEYNYTQEEVADRIGKSRSTVANFLGLLTLDERVIDFVRENRLSAGHAKNLTSVENGDRQYEFALKAIDGKMSVREFESFVKSKRKTNVEEKKPQISLELRDFVANMQRAFATKVSVIGNDKKGRIYIDYYSRDDLDRINNLIVLSESIKNS